MRIRRAGALAAAAGLLTIAGPAVATPELDPDAPCPVPSCDVAVAATRKGQLKLLDATDGQLYGHLDLRPPHVDEDGLEVPPITSISLHGDDVYYSVYENEINAYGIWRTTTAGSELERLADGAAPAVSPDGRFLAYSFDPTGPARGRGTTSIAVRDLRSGKERHIAPASSEHEDDPAVAGGFIDAISWSPDSARLAYSVAYRLPGPPPSTTHGVFVFDLASQEWLLDSRWFERPFRSPSWSAEDGLLAVSSCCFSDVDGIGRVFRLDPVMGGETEVDTSGGVPLSDEAVGMVDARDTYGTELLVVRDASGALDRIGPRGELRRLGSGYAAVDW
ncbi:MAG: hypothetical protein ACRD0C_08625 [Acidimicrobiia bacterium]